MLADGSVIPSPGQSVIVKLLNNNTPNGLGSAISTVRPAFLQSRMPGQASLWALTTAWTRSGQQRELPDPGAYSELRILGIPGNQTTGQQRVPVILTSLRDDTVGTTVRGVVMDSIANSIPYYTTVFNKGATLTTPAAGDSGYIYIGGESLTEYDPTNPFDGSVISNADISYMSRIEVQGAAGSSIRSTKPEGRPAPTLTNTDWYDTLTGYLDPVNQINSVDDVHDLRLESVRFLGCRGVRPSPGARCPVRDWTGLDQYRHSPDPERGGLVGEPVDLYMYNDTISNSAIGVYINSPQGDDTTGDTQYQAILLNNTFYNDAFAIQTISPQFNGMNGLSRRRSLLAMNNIFDGSSNTAINLLGQDGGAQIQYNLFFATTRSICLSDTRTSATWPELRRIYGNPEFVGPVGSRRRHGAELRARADLAGHQRGP